MLDIQFGPIIRNQKTSNKGCDLLQLVRRLSSSKIQEAPISNRKYLKTLQSKTVKSKPHFHHEGINVERQHHGEDPRHVVDDVMGANVSRHSTKGLSGRRSQSSGSICNGKWRHQGDGSGKSSGGGSLPSYLDDRASTSTNNYNNEEEERGSQLDENERIPPLGNGAPLHWKFADGQTSCQDQGYGSERSPEEEYPPPLPEHDMEQCHHHLEAHSCYPFITPESTFTVKLNKGSRGLGLSVTGGIESGGSWPGLVRIKRLFPHQPASSCGLLNVGDLLLEANGVPLTGLSNYEALEVLRTATNQVELKVCRPPPDVLNCVSPVSDVPPPPPTRREPPNTLNLTSNYFGNTPGDEYFHGEFEVTLTKIQGSLGFTLRKEDNSALGHYVRALVREPALTDGRIKAGDRIIAVNDVEIFSMTHEQAVQYLRKCGDKVKLRLYRDSPQTPVATLSPAETTPRTSISKKTNLRQEAVDMLNDIAARKMVSNHQRVATTRSLSPTSFPRTRLRRQNYPSDASQDSASRYPLPEEQFHEGMLKCKHFDEESLFTIDSDDLDRPARYDDYKNPAYQSAHPPCLEKDPKTTSRSQQKEETDTIKRKKGILKKDSSYKKIETKTEVDDKAVPMKEEFEILAIELNRGWNSRLGFSLQGAAGVTYVSAVYADSVAAKDGRIKPGDRIIKVNDENVEHMNTNEIIDLLRIVRGPVCIVVKRINSTEDCGKSNAEN
ncbi:hypothetical protein ABEB36_013434 [Hypothenemus hampei]|uniref:PDZ domain-containing protein n=1 Tax=Hypothenemus hampei TaxID=57062 RepID=A0ABD1E881_HYPHA